MKGILSEYDVIVIGSGIAGLYTALKISKYKRVLIISKDELTNSNTNLAQGGVAVTFNKKDIDSHVQDTMRTGFHYNDIDRLRTMVEDGGKCINTLINWGVNFDRDDHDNLLLTKEGGHSLRRIIHYKDTTGQEIIRGLIEAVYKADNITCISHTFVSKLLVHENKIYGIQCLEDKQISNIYATHVVLATGGIGELYKHTTNACIATGDGIAMAYDVGVAVKDMEFVQFHPTALNVPGHSHFLISEAVRGEGGILRNKAGIAFMASYHELKDLAPRSIVSKSILEECKKQASDQIYLDVTHLPEDYIKNRFPNIYQECFNRGIDIVKEWIPIIPVQHYMMGGIETDALGRTCVEGLYACGEVACTGVHGANRMASNSLLEGAVYADRVAEDINSSSKVFERQAFEILNLCQEDPIVIHSLKVQLQEVMNSHVFIFRKNRSLILAKKIVDDLSDQVTDFCQSQEAFELRNMIIVAKLIIEGALKREDSLGSHIMEGDD